MGSQRISDIHPKLMLLQYPLLFPYGEDGLQFKFLTSVKERMSIKGSM
jgi:hypothetical protein